MRIGIDARFYGSVGKGLGRYTERLVCELEKIDQENEYIIFLCKENFDEYQPKNKHFTKVLTQSRWYSFSEQFFFPWVLYRENLDLVHFPHFNVPLLYRKSFIVTLHDLILFHYPTEKASTRSSYLYWLKFSLYRIVLASALRRSKKVITVSEFTKADIFENYPFVKEKITVTKEAVEDFCYWQNSAVTESFFKRYHLINKDGAHGILQPYFLYVGNAYPHKNLSTLVDIASVFRDTFFVLVGKEDFFYKQLKEEAQKRDVQNIIFTGYVTEVELGALYRNAKLYLFPSLYEGFGLPPLEAMQYGIPVVSSERGSLPEVLGDAALYFNPESTKEFIQKIETLYSDGNLQEKCRLKGYSQAAGYSWVRMAKQTLDVYQE